MKKLACLILTKDESIHIERAIKNIKSLDCDIVVCDSYSSDNTIDLAKENDVIIYQNHFINHSSQLNWAIDKIRDDYEWILRLDADEIIDKKLGNSIKEFLNSKLSNEFDGCFLNRRIAFQGKEIKWGGLFPSPNLRLFRSSKGRSEERWMDEHIIVNGNTMNLEGELIDKNLSSVSKWIDKHNGYASKEVIDILVNSANTNLNKEVMLSLSKQSRIKRFFKYKLYYKLPFGFRPLLYFLYRYFVRLGFLDGVIGSQFHFLQGFWYRYLVDVKLYLFLREKNNSNKELNELIYEKFDIRL